MSGKRFEDNFHRHANFFKSVDAWVYDVHLDDALAECALRREPPLHFEVWSDEAGLAHHFETSRHVLQLLTDAPNNSLFYLWHRQKERVANNRVLVAYSRDSF